MRGRIIKIENCKDCPVVDNKDIDFTCELRDCSIINSDEGELRSKKSIPDWCPLRKQPVLLQIENIDNLKKMKL